MNTSRLDLYWTIAPLESSIHSWQWAQDMGLISMMWTFFWVPGLWSTNCTLLGKFLISQDFSVSNGSNGRINVCGYA